MSEGSLHHIQGIQKFLTALPEQTLLRLYESPANCLVIFRMLPVFARHIILNILWITSNVTLEQLQVMLRKSDHTKLLDSAMMALEQIHLISLENHSLTMDSAFRTSFKQALTGGGERDGFGRPTVADDLVTIAVLDKYAADRWEMILHYMVGSEMRTNLSPNVLSLLKKAGLMDSSSRSAAITSQGFQFLLEDVNRQLWDLLLSYLAVAEEKEMDLVQVLSFLFLLGSMELGRAYSTKKLDQVTRQVLSDLVDFGLIYQPATSPSVFYPTRLATTLTSSTPPLLSTASVETEKGYLLVETNYRVYAYTSNSLQIAILNLFVTMKARFPNIIIASLTRESVKNALQKGISADQIISFLTAHAHPQMRKSETILPPTVCDQIRLWERERSRITSLPGYLYDEFRAAGDFQLVRDYARQLGVIIWEADPSLPPPTCWRFFVDEEGHPPVRDFIKRRMAAASSAS